MKKILVTLPLLFQAMIVWSQLNKGTVMIGGAANMRFRSYDKNAGDVEIFDLSGRAGYMIDDNLNAGLYLAYEKISDADDPTLSGGPFLRYYFKNRIFVGAGYLFTKQGEYSITTMPLEVGYTWFLRDAVALEPDITYSLYDGDANGSVLQINVGIAVYLAKK